MSQASQVRTYDRSASVVFLKTNERFGGLSNMAPGFPLRVNGVRIRTSEALYQACRFPHMPDVQRKIIDEHSPMTAKMRSKPFRNDSRPDWDAVRVKIMKWCLRVKLAHHWSAFGTLLLDTGDRPIVEQSRKDDFWGAKVGDDGKLVGMNVLGRLLMELREEIKSRKRERSTAVPPLEIRDFLLLGQSIEPIGLGSDLVAARTEADMPETDFYKIPAQIEANQRSLFEPPWSKPLAPKLATVNGLRFYTEMKPSGLRWLGDIPSHWDVRRNGRLFGSRRETGFPDLPVLEVSLRTGVRVRDFDSGTRKQEMGDRSKYQRAVRGDIAYNMMRMWQGAVGIAPVDGLVSPAYVVARPFDDTNAAYYAYVFRTASYMREVDTFSRGIVPDRNRLYWESFKQMPSVYPPLEEQRLIVRFLDWHGAQTAKLIRAKKKVIALLNEQKQAISHHAVTRGLDPNVRLKPSGIPWLGDMPEGWEVQRVGRLIDLTVGYAFKSSGFTAVDDDIRLLRGINVSPGKIRWQSIVRWPAEHAKAFSGFALRVGDVVIGMDRPVIQSGIRIARVSEIDVPSLLLQRVARIRFLSGIDEQFGLMMLGGKGFIDYLTPIFSGISVPHISPQQISDFRFALPAIEEQRKIVSTLKVQTRDIEATLKGVDSEIALIHEFRTRLIADVVTGKLDVRTVVASLPDTSEFETTDDLVEDDVLDEVFDDPENEEVAA